MFSHLHHCGRFLGWQSVASVGIVLVGGEMARGSLPGLVSSGLLGSQPRRTWGPCQPVVAWDAVSVGEVWWRVDCLSETGCCSGVQQWWAWTVVNCPGWLPAGWNHC